jgi:putative membrane protein insertion efficiency factor
MSTRLNYKAFLKISLVVIVVLLVIDATAPPHQQVSVRFALAGIWMYQHSFSLLLKNSNMCKFQPTCSNYSKMALEKYGIAKGTAMTGMRLLRCSPFSSKRGKDYP